MHAGTLLFLIVFRLTTVHAEDFYEILGIERSADQKDIRRAFKKLAIAEHPDKNFDDPEAHEKFIRLAKAYETLKDPDLRKKYDTFGEAGLGDSDRTRTYQTWNYQNYFGIYDNDPDVVTLDENDYQESVLYSEKIWMVNFYSPMCSHCHHIAPAWRKIAAELKGAVQIAAVNCEEEWQLCRRYAIRAYPTLLLYPKNSNEGERFTGQKTYENILRFVLDRINVPISHVDRPLTEVLSNNRKPSDRPMILFVCDSQRYCFTPDDRVKIAATLESVVDVGLVSCTARTKCDDALAPTAGVVFLPVDASSRPVPFDGLDDANDLVNWVFDQLPETPELDAADFQRVRENLEEDASSETGWLICFYIGRPTDIDLTLKKLSGSVKTAKLGKMNCSRHPELCNGLNVNRYPMWAVFKPGGAYEVNHERDTINGIVKFLDASLRAANVWALTAEQATAIMERRNGDEPWFLDWYSPRCPPCIHFLKEVRKASVEFDRSVVRFGTIDCMTHSTVCTRYNIRSYPTSMLINGTETQRFLLQESAASIVQFINDARNPSVVRLTSRNYERRLAKRKGKLIWLVEYFAPWCGPCQRLAPEWASVGRALAVLPFVKVASVDCEAESSLCSGQGIRSYPTIRLYPSDTDSLSTFTLYKGQRDSVSILSWVAQYFPRKVRNLDPQELQTEALADQNLWIVDYFAPWCEHCRILEPQFAIAAQLLKSSVQFGRLNCDRYGTECARANVRLYPTLMAYDPRYQKKRIGHGFVINGTTAEAIRRSIVDFSTRISHDEL